MTLPTQKEAEEYFRGRGDGYRWAMEDVLKKLRSCHSEAGLRRALQKLVDQALFERTIR